MGELWGRKLTEEGFTVGDQKRNRKEKETLKKCASRPSDQWAEALFALPVTRLNPPHESYCISDDTQGGSRGVRNLNLLMDWCSFFFHSFISPISYFSENWYNIVHLELKHTLPNADGVQYTHTQTAENSVLDLCGSAIDWCDGG